MRPKTETWGLLAEFDDPTSLIEAAEKTREAGYTRIDAFTPFPVEGLHEAIGFHHTKLPMIVLAGGILGFVTGFGMQYFATVIHYPLNIGGRPLNSWPAWIPISFELAILFAAFAAIFGMLALNRLPEPYHPVFNVGRFVLATRDQFFLSIEASDPKFRRDETRRFLEALRPLEVSDVPW
ncbi:MAG TPA: DUF3341 domain-containing protein [Thermoanaerobaculia bacterium]|nr:DUF3341 domain-containing protein [Thermoanaerobaculia bacterium]